GLRRAIRHRCTHSARLPDADRAVHDDVRRVRTRSRRLNGIEEMSTLPDPTGQLSPEARQIYEQIVGTRHHDYPGLFRSLMNYPELAQRFAEFGNLLR